ncbi:hypothetical protein [Chitinilyticum litopenaei]|uniref:hypothetical protein n=1 Tax=Chitinilyticum litopenaei TaxID=1121276 RepID=UPI00118717E3|nr:hypothetical protein [Chitinilyticum litopenaei]
MPDLRALWRIYLQPWRLGSFLAGLALLIAGGKWYQLNDWDDGVSLLMAGLTYLLMPYFDWCLAARERWLAAFMVGNFCVDTSYALYWAVLAPDREVTVRVANYSASWCLFIACWLVWFHFPRRLARAR